MLMNWILRTSQDCVHYTFRPRISASLPPSFPCLSNQKLPIKSFINNMNSSMHATYQENRKRIMSDLCLVLKFTVAF